MAVNKFIESLNKNFVPKMNKVTNNIYVQALQQTIMQALPMIFVGSIATIIATLFSFFPSLNFPDLSPLNTFSFGLFSIFVAFLTPYNILERKRMNKTKIIAGLTSMSLFFMLIRIDFGEEVTTINFARLGAEGMLCAILSGLFVAFVMSFFYNFSLFKEDSVIPDFVKSWFNNAIPIFLILAVGYVLIILLDFDIFKLIIDLFNPITKIGQSFMGFVLMNFICVFFYSFGISPWILTPIVYSIYLPGMAENVQMVANGLPPTNINTAEAIYGGWVAIGGLGTTLPLNVMMLSSKSKKIKAIGKATIVPSIMNINEPLVYGAPITFNPLLMMPFWIVSIVVPAITYVVLRLGFAPIPSEAFYVAGLPLGIATWLISPAFGSLILLAALFIIAYLIYYPFYKAYERQELASEGEES